MIRYEYVYGFTVPNKYPDIRFNGSMSLSSVDEVSSKVVLDYILESCCKDVERSVGCVLSVRVGDITLGFVGLVNKYRD